MSVHLVTVCIFIGRKFCTVGFAIRYYKLWKIPLLRTPKLRPLPTCEPSVISKPFFSITFYTQCPWIRHYLWDHPGMTFQVTSGCSQEWSDVGILLNFCHTHMLLLSIFMIDTVSIPLSPRKYRLYIRAYGSHLLIINHCVCYYFHF